MSVYSISAASTAITNLNNLIASKQELVKLQQTEVFKRMDAEARIESMIEKNLITDQRQELKTNAERLEQQRIQDILVPQNPAQTADTKTPVNGLSRDELRPGSMRYDWFRELQNPNLVNQPEDDNTTIGAWLDETA